MRLAGCVGAAFTLHRGACPFLTTYMLRGSMRDYAYTMSAAFTIPIWDPQPSPVPPSPRRGDLQLHNYAYYYCDTALRQATSSRTGRHAAVRVRPRPDASSAHGIHDEHHFCFSYAVGIEHGDTILSPCLPMT